MLNLAVKDCVKEALAQSQVIVIATLPVVRETVTAPVYIMHVTTALVSVLKTATSRHQTRAIRRVIAHIHPLKAFVLTDAQIAGSRMKPGA
jgi:hypothetical protein